ncbi:helix-turn-helix transcriptional regulator [Slackia exigua]|uniref:helix-turn-helix transcriptional regulator n=1 Tax=Slackia exigua TaxID=84109 RepID=UPI00210935F4|nr:helix-turn-helix transcriptional regulator [Slackia exigua]MCQ5091291.1 helix-turn-helix transcriptional regulator [Slackia exigua]
MPAASRGEITEQSEAGLSQAQLAQVVGVDRQTICCIEPGGYNLTLNLRIAICKTLGKTPDDLFWTEWGTTMSPLKSSSPAAPRTNASPP